MNSVLLKTAGIIFAFCMAFAFSDTMEDYTWTDVDGKAHHLYGYCNTGKWIALFMTKPGD